MCRKMENGEFYERKYLNENKAYIDKSFAITFVGYLLFGYNFKQKTLYDAF